MKHHHHTLRCWLAAVCFLAVSAMLHAASGDNLVSHWAFDGTVTDSGPAGNNPTGQNSAATPSFASGFFDQALTLDGGGHLLVPNESDYDFAGGGGFTISGWFQVDSFTKSWQALVAKGEGNAFRLHRSNNSNNLNFVAGPGARPNNGANVNDGAWHHVVAVHTGGVGTNLLYVDGVAASGATTGNVGQNNAQVRIGNNPNQLGREFDGQIDDLAIWGRPLTADEVGVLYNSGLGIQVSTFLQPVWTGLGGDNNWSTNPNWTTPPTASDNVFFQGNTRLTPNNDFAAGTAFGDVTFEPGAGAFNLGGNRITLDGNLVNNSTSAQTVGMGLTLPAGTHDFNANAGDLAVTGVIDGTGGIRKVGNNQVTLSGANTYTGTTNVDAGTLQIGGVAFSTTPRDYVVADGAVLNIDGNTGVASGTTSISGAGELRVTNGDFSNEGPNFPRGPGRNLNLSLSGANAQIDIQAGAYMRNGGWQNINWAGNTAALNVDGTFNLWDGNEVRVGAVSGSGSGEIRKDSGGGTKNFVVGLDNGDGNFSGTATFNNSGSPWNLVKEGSGTQTFSGTVGPVTVFVNDGVLQLQNGVFGQQARSYTVADGAVLNIDGNSGFASGTSSITGAGELRITGGNVGNENPNNPRGSGRNVNISLSGANSGIDVQTGAFLRNGGWQAINWAGNTAPLNVDGTFDVWDGNNVRVGALSGSGSIVRGHGGGGNKSLTIGLDNGSANFSGTIENATGTVTVIKSGTGTQTLSGTNSHTGGTTINGGTLRILTDRALGAVPGSFDPDNVILDGGILKNDGPTINLNGNRGITLQGDGRIDVRSNTTISVPGAITGTGRLTKEDNGILTLTGTNSHTGGTTIGAGTVRIGGDRALGAVPGSFDPDNLILDGGTLKNDGPSVTLDANRGVTLQSNSRIDVRNGTTVTIPGVVAGSGDLRKEDGGILTLSGANTYTGTTNVNNGTLVLQGGAFSTTARDYVVANGAVLNIDGNTGHPTGTSSISGDGELRVTGGNFGNESPNSPRGSGRNINLSLSDDGRIDVQAGAFMRNGGWQSINWAGNTAPLNVDGTFDLWDGREVRVGALSGSGLVQKGHGGGGVKNFVVGLDDGSADFSGRLNLANGGSRYILVKEGTGTQTISGTADNNSARVRVEDGTLVLAKASTGSVHAAAIEATVNGGTLQLGGTGNDQIYFRSDVTVNGGTFDLNGRNEGFDSLNGSGGTILNNAAATTSTLTIGQDNGGGSYSGTFADGAGSLAVVKTGNGTQTFSGTNSHTGGTTINGGTLRIGTDRALGAVPGSFDPDNVILDGGILKNDGPSVALDGNRGIALQRNGRIDVRNGTTVTIPGIISGSGDLTKADGGILNLTGDNTYTGNTTVNNGTLLLNGVHSGSGLIAVQSGATLGGSGRAPSAPVLLEGSLAPGNSPDIIGPFGSFTFAAGSTYDWEILDSAGSAGPTGWDRLDVTGLFTIDDATDFSIDVAGVVSFIPDTAVLTNGFTIIKGYDTGPFDIVDYGTFGITSGTLGDITVDPGPFGHLGYFTLTDTGSLLQLTFTATVPEPSTWALFGLILGAGVLLTRRRARRRDAVTAG